MSFPVPARVSKMLPLLVGALAGAAVATLASRTTSVRHIGGALAPPALAHAAPPPSAAPPPAPPCTLPAVAPDPTTPWPALAGITWTDPTHARVEQRLVDRVLAEPSSIARGARVIPSVTDGRPSGFKLYAVRPDSLYAALGLRSGDTVVAVNGLPVTNPDTALEAYTRVRAADHLDVELRRRGQPLTLHYRLVPAS